MNRSFVMLYGALNYFVFLGVFLYAVGFVGGFVVPTRLDGPLQGSLTTALVVNLVLLTIFALQHSVMARPWFKDWLLKYISPPLERSTYVMFTNIALILLFCFWRPMGGVIWDFQNPLVRGLLWALFGFGWLTVLVTTFLINHFDLFGLRQVWLFFQGKPYTQLSFVTPGPYQIVRHPLYIGWFFAFWSTPTMTMGHLLFAIVTTAYILVAIQLEERDLLRYFGERYDAYRRRVPMLIPRFGKKNESSNP